jgi:hypothetical protein
VDKDKDWAQQPHKQDSREELRCKNMVNTSMRQEWV